MSPETIIALFRRLKGALNENDRVSVNEIALQLIAGRADIGPRWKTIATVLQHNGEFNAVNRAMELLTIQCQRAPGTLFDQAALLAQTGRLSQAWQVMTTVPRDVPDRASHSFILGSMAINLGSIEAAQANLLDALNANPKLGQAMLSLAVSENMGIDHEIGDRIVAAHADMTSAHPLEQAHYRYAVGKVHFDRGEVEQAIAHIAKGAALISKERPYDAQADSTNALKCRSGYTLEFINAVSSRVSVPTDRPIFVTGLPRSGTTLVEQILISHSCIVGGEELGCLPIVEREIGGADKESFQRRLQSTTPDALASLYLHLGSERFGTEGRFIDKSLNASRFMGVIASLLPDAPIIWLRRDPLDCAWSAYRTYFLRGLDWSWNLTDIARHFRLEDQLFAHWSQLLGKRILRVDYDALVQNPNPMIERIAAHCGLVPEPGMFSPHETKRPVMTASVVQVRQPINTRSIKSSKSYLPYLKPFTDAYF